MSEVATQTLHIVARELNAELNDARLALENFGEQQDDIRFLENCRERLHHVHGALRVAEVHGAALLAEEMEQVACYLIDNFSEKRHLAEGLDALMRAMVQLPTYLDRVMSGGRDMALILLPLLNDLRAVRGHALLSEGTLLVLNLRSEKQANPKALEPGEPVIPVANWARKLRTRFQLGLLGWIKGERVEQNLDILARTAEKIEQVATTQPVFQLWWVVGAVVEALSDGALEGSASIKRLLGQADRELRRLYEVGEQQYTTRPPIELLNNLLYYVARAATNGPRVKAVRTSFKLDELLPVDAHVEAARESLAAPSAKLMKTVAGAIKEDLAHVKDAFDIFVRQSASQSAGQADGTVSAAQLAPQLDLLRKIGDTLGVLGLAELRDRVQTEIADLRTLIEQPGGKLTLGEARLMRIAGTLINIEDSLDEQLIGLIRPTDQSPAESQEKPDIEFRQVSEAVLRECIVNMARIKEAIALSFEKPREPQVLDQLPELNRGITAGLQMLGKNRAMETAGRIGRCMSQHIHAGAPTSRDSMDRLADAIVAVEYYLETLHAGRNDPWYMLDNADACLQALEDIASGSAIVSMLPDLGDHSDTMASDQIETLALERVERTQVMSTVQQVTQVIPSQHARRQAAQATTASNATTATPPARGPLVALEAGTADAEFVELFIEEARDVLANLQRAFPLWEGNPADQESLTQLRRSFHTLKGSGRVVGALAIGELAWSIENMLNRVINRTLDRTPNMLSLLRETMTALPALIEQLESGRVPPVDVPDLVARANLIAQVRDSAARSVNDSLDASAIQRATVVIAKAASVSKKEDSTGSAASQVTSAPSANSKIAAKTAADMGSATLRQPKLALPMDPGLHEVFSKETTGHLQAIREYVASCAVLAAPYPVTEALHRACHTLRGAAKTAGARHGIKISEPLNHYIRKLYDNSIGLPPAGLQLLRDAVRAIEMVVLHINEATGYFVTHQSIIERITKLEAQLDNELTHMADNADATQASPVPELRYDESFRQRAFEPATITVGEDVVELSFDAAAEHKHFGLGMARGSEVAAQSHETLVLSKPVLSKSALSKSALGEAMLTPALGKDEKAHDDLVREQTLEISIPDLTDPSLNTLATSAIAGSLLREESIVIEAIDLTASLAAPQFAPPIESPTAQHTAPRIAPPAAAMPFTSRAEAAAPSLESTIISLPTVSFDDIESTNISAPSGMEADQLVVDSIEIDAEELTAIQSFKLPMMEEPLPPAKITAAAQAVLASSPPLSIQASLPAVSVSVQSEPDAEIEMELQPDDFDADIAAIFSEEATELMEVADAAMSSWSHDLANKSALFELKRAVHTLKGGARMAGIPAMGNLSHEYETFVERIESGSITANDAVIAALQACLDELHRMRDAVSAGKPVAPARALIARLHSLAGFAPVREVAVAHKSPAPEPERAPQVASAPPAQAPAINRVVEAPAPTASSLPIVVDSFAAEPVPDLEAEFTSADFENVNEIAAHPVVQPALDDEANYVEVDLSAELTSDTSAESISDPVSDPGAAPMALPGREHVRDERQQEVARVDAELLDNLLNNAGEVSILRSRVEQQVNSVEFNLQELNRTVTRLKEQMRNLELETEAQILHRHQEEKAGREDFDPLELDRYSQIQQLSRALAESVSDVSSIEGLLENMAREAQSLLLQQSRVVTEVQNGLMRTRMVPFQRHVQRLSRIVRQVASETHKRADLLVSGASGEMDRQVLERMLPPFEHMLRNSIVHGIETPAERVAAGKTETGTIKIGLRREGSEMVICVEDDGRGIDVNAVRERAIERGLLKAGRKLTDEEALQLVLEPGFSTASSVTQHAGRGVGMDVVVAEIKKLGGALFTESQAGQGVKFTIRLPFSLAVAQSLLIRVGEEQYALPLPTIEGVARIPRAEVIAHLRSERASFHYGEQLYRIQHLGAFIGAPAASLPDADLPIPVILIRAGEHSTGLVVDELVGNREIVIKPVGPQVSSVRGIAGATILGDGRIVVILDMGALVRSEWRNKHEVAAPSEDRRAFALVVDDSITVRRVTQRLLERNGMRVLTAKDGVDALEILNDHLPDVILLDIEMPRMDGYEFATRVRADARIREIPIVMITSRVGDKHRAHAMEIGVNDYMGKPFQENQLLDTIEALIDTRRGGNKSKAVH